MGSVIHLLERGVLVEVLSTKLSIPPVRSGLVERERLFKKLDQGLECGFILVSAPAGYGKSTLLSAWLSQVDFAYGWISLDDRDNDLARFLAYLTAALRTIDPSLPELFEEKLPLNPEQDLETILTPLINRLDRVKRPVCLVLDDYHQIQEALIHRTVGFILEHRPAALHVVIATRADPPLPLSRLRARSELMELRQSDLRFSMQETADFLNHTMGLQVQTEDVHQIAARTEGWVAGLQMAGLSLQNIEDVSGGIKALTGTHRYIFDYLMEEILDRQPQEIHRFLLHTSILEQLTAPLCDFLLEDPAHSSTELLEKLDRANLFIVPLDTDRQWFRFHPLFAELLQGYLKKDNPNLIPALHDRASLWFEEQVILPEAIHHALAAGKWERVVHWISANVFALLEQNELSTVARRLDSLTSENSHPQPWLCIGRAWLAAYTGQIRTVDSILETAEAEINDLPRADDQRRLYGHVAAIRAFSSWILGEREVAVRTAKEALDCLDATESVIRCQTATVLGLALAGAEERARAYEQALVYARQSSLSHVTFFAYGCWAYHLLFQGRLHETQAACLEAIRLAQTGAARQPLPTLSYIYATLSMVLCEWNDLDGALRYAREAVALARRWEQADAHHFTSTVLVSTLLEMGEVNEAIEICKRAWQIAHCTSRWFEDISIAQEVELHLGQGNAEAAVQRLRLAQIDIDEPPQKALSSSMYLAVAQLLLAQKQYAKALLLIEAFLAREQKNQYLYLQVRALAWQAIAYHGLGQEVKALASLKRALDLAAPEGYIRSFLVSSGALIPVLRQARQAGIYPDYTDRLLSDAEGEFKCQPAASKASTALVEPLSERELEVLKLLAQGFSDKKIAETLFLARDTVHTHLKNIYSKLDVHSRTEAIAQARQLDLL